MPTLRRSRSSTWAASANGCGSGRLAAPAATAALAAAVDDALVPEPPPPALPPATALLATALLVGEPVTLAKRSSRSLSMIAVAST